MKALLTEIRHVLLGCDDGTRFMFIGKIGYWHSFFLYFPSVGSNFKTERFGFSGRNRILLILNLMDRIYSLQPSPLVLDLD